MKENQETSTKEKEYSLQNSSESESDSNEGIQEIDDCLYLDDEEADKFISTDMNENTLQKFLQREMEFYATAFPTTTFHRISTATLSRKLGR